MADYQEMYLTLFRAATKAIDLLDRGKGMEARALLIRAQQETEELCRVRDWHYCQPLP